ncbi:uncharacterized protein NPIL_445471 [Nephila pilipes]|uniref:Uncharacterized protein n=1 Tax=Nephila pilipes TaxID=299642 RepID=A0A8X6UB37_NEPPI|nr:uncharacterized protein NPIL_445471 [Nephila pilipes]
MEKKIKQQKYLQMCIGKNQNPVCFKLTKDSTIEISFNPKGKNIRDQIWIPPPAKTTKRAPHKCSNKYSKNQIIISMPEDGTVISPRDHSFRIESCHDKSVQAEFHPKTILDQTSVSKEYELLPERQNQAQQMKDNFQMQEHFLEEAERFLKMHENKQKILSKYCLALKKNMQDINESINELENQENNLFKTKYKQNVARVRYQNEQKDFEVPRNLVPGKKTKRNILDDQDEDNQDTMDYFDIHCKKSNLKRVQSVEDVSRLYLPISRPDSQEKKEFKKLPAFSEKCVPTENLMIKLADNMRKTKLLIDAVCHEDEIIDTMQKKYLRSVERLYSEQYQLLEQLNQTLDSVNNYDILDGSLDKSREKCTQIKNGRATKDIAKQDDTVVYPTENKISERKHGIFKRRSAPDLHTLSETDHTDKPDDDKQTSRSEKESERISPNRISYFDNNTAINTRDKRKSSTPDNSKGYTCETIIKEIVRHFPSKPEDRVNTINASKAVNDFKSGSYDCKTEIKQTLRCPPLNVKGKTSKINIHHPMTNLLQDINKAIDQLTISCKYTLFGEKKNVNEEGSPTNDISRTIPKKFYQPDASQHQDESEKAKEHFNKSMRKVKYDKNNKKHREPKEISNFKKNNSIPRDFLYDDRTQTDSIQSFTQISVLENCNCSGPCTNSKHYKSSYEQSDSSKKETGKKRKPILFDEGTQSDSTQSFTQISAKEKCNCSGPCTNSKHYESNYDLSDSSRKETDNSKKDKTFYGISHYKPLEGSMKDISLYKPLEGSLDDSENQKSFRTQGTQSGLSGSSSESLKSEDISQSDLHSTITKHSETNKTKDISVQVEVQSLAERNKQSTMSEFLYSLPTTSKEITGTPLYTSTPKKIARYKFRNPEDISEYDNIPGTTNIERARDKINNLYDNIMKRF